MSYIVKIGTTEAIWNDNHPIPEGFVEYIGELTDDLIWGDDVNNLRQRSASESLAAKRLKRVSEINVERDRREQSTFPYMSKQVQCDPISVQRISVAAATAQMALAASVPYSVDWSCADNSILSLDALGVLGMMQALGAHGIAIHYYARTLKDQVAVSSDPESIDILTGWPS